MSGEGIAETGSSPLTRGKLVSFDGTTRFNGLIPAHAGKTRLCSSRPRTCRAHPRSRGENLYPRSSNSLVRGSSPLTRGKQDNHGLVACGVGLIPAHAGKTWAARELGWEMRAHPRSRGENITRVVRAICPTGSSPLTRGKPRPTHPRPCPPRLIPAHAGKTTGRHILECSLWAHPRSRGENVGGPVLRHIG